MATRSANVNVRDEPEIKTQAESILERLGVSASAFINDSSGNRNWINNAYCFVDAVSVTLNVNGR